MSVDNQPGKGSPENQEWRGQRWDYLTVEMLPGKPRDLRVAGKEESLYGKLKKDNLWSKKLKFLGSEGWELCGIVPGLDHPLLFFKRPVDPKG